MGSKIISMLPLQHDLHHTTPLAAYQLVYTTTSCGFAKKERATDCRLKREGLYKG
ncbi:hypothetical protein AVDCRST_MAG94-2843 [uncultured Leptolyngbya sp.]|uniref:Uncharacterized protein n=2 Tax=Cyanophyceae TaxID=3028117 RepID=A0A6J4M9G0_9CYAN|nr:hypothetical protein AVDCRST_MAG94-2843 [uncultured Leptolyngbya sp.]CAA9575057.1 hypothetical protein AVDCRST_MAG81-2238 [uncultured Synechococcales cyanobacterium]